MPSNDTYTTHTLCEGEMREVAKIDLEVDLPSPGYNLLDLFLFYFYIHLYCTNVKYVIIIYVDRGFNRLDHSSVKLSYFYLNEIWQRCVNVYS